MGSGREMGSKAPRGEVLLYSGQDDAVACSMHEAATRAALAAKLAALKGYDFCGEHESGQRGAAPRYFVPVQTLVEPEARRLGIATEDDLFKDAGWELPKRQLHADPDLPAYRRRSVPARDNRVLAACAAFRGDVLIIESEHDDTVPHRVIENYVAAFSGARSLTSRVIAAADHALSQKEHQQAYTKLLINWLTEMVLGARADALGSEGE